MKNMVDHICVITAIIIKSRVTDLSKRVLGGSKACSGNAWSRACMSFEGLSDEEVKIFDGFTANDASETVRVYVAWVSIWPTVVISVVTFSGRAIGGSNDVVCGQKDATEEDEPSNASVLGFITIDEDFGFYYFSFPLPE
ncbi:hypothetical protein ACH5RR_018334 [Cinchona calisaya]|uniref:Uncharacterized protein n=1 Tax=Cinchona calisaya TaxID=153742 RepID=A0ABD2ZPS4_9GENT